jgi:hypothetical protein
LDAAELLAAGNQLLQLHLQEVWVAAQPASWLKPLLLGPEAPLVRALAVAVQFEQLVGPDIPSWSPGKQLFALKAAADAAACASPGRQGVAEQAAWKLCVCWVVQGVRQGSAVDT